MTGNPVRIRGGCATVTGYKLPMPLRKREGGSEVKPEARIPIQPCSSGGGRSQKTEVRVVALLTSDFALLSSFSVKEKDEASPADLFSSGFLNAFIL